jgi:putative sterol carrier protein
MELPRERRRTFQRALPHGTAVLVSGTETLVGSRAVRFRTSVLGMARARSDPTTRFFDELAGRAHEPLLRKATGSTQFDVRDGRRTRRWVVTVDDGDITVSKGGGEASSVMRVEKEVFDKIVTGRMNAVAAVLRGELALEGDWRMLVRIQRLFPGRRSRT